MFFSHVFTHIAIEIIANTSGYMLTA